MKRIFIYQISKIVKERSMGVDYFTYFIQYPDNPHAYEVTMSEERLMQFKAHLHNPVVILDSIGRNIYNTRKEFEAEEESAGKEEIESATYDLNGNER